MYAHTAPQSILDDVDEEDNGDDGNPYDSYSAPEVEKPQEEMNVDSENKKLLGNALEDLSGDDSPIQGTKKNRSVDSPVPDNNKFLPNSNGLQSDSDTSLAKQDLPEKSPQGSPKIKPGVWPPPSNDVREQPDESGPPLKIGQPTVLQKWQPKEWKKEEKESNKSPKPSKIDISSWAKNVKQVEVKRSIAKHELDALKKPAPKEKEEKLPPPPIAPKVKKEKKIIEEVPKNRFVALKPIKKQEDPTPKNEPESVAPIIKLKKSGGKKVCTCIIISILWAM